MQPIKPIEPFKPGLLVSCALFFLIPFLGGNHLPLPHATIDRFWIEGVFTLLIVISTLLAYLAFKNEDSDFPGFLLFFLPFFLISAGSLLYTWNFFATLSSMNVLVWSAGCVYIYHHSDKKEALLRALVLGGAVSAICAVIQYRFLFPGLLDVFRGGSSGQIVREQAGIPFSSYLHHNMLGGCLAFLLPLGFYFGVYKKGSIYMVASVLLLTGLVLTSTRIGMGLAIVVTLSTVICLVKTGDRKGLIVLGAILAGSVLVIILLFSGARAKGGTEVQNIIGQKVRSAYTQLSTVNTRTEIWRNGFRAFKGSPLVGFGAGTFEYGYRRYFDGGAYTRVAHNTFLKIGVELGLVGVLTFILYLYGTGRAIRRGLSGAEPIHLFIALSFISCFLFGLVDFSFDVRSHVVSFFLLSSAFFHPGQGRGDRDRGSGKAAVRVAVIFILITALLLTSFIFTARANLARKSLDDGAVAEENVFFTDAYLAYRNAIEEMPFENEGYIRATAILIKSYQNQKDEDGRGKMKVGISHYLKRMEKKRDRDSEVYFMLGKGYGLLGDQEKADRYFSMALACYPSSPYYTFEAAEYYFTHNRKQKAGQLIRSFDPYIDLFRTPHNPRGLWVYKLRDLEAALAFDRGDTARALTIVRTNYEDAKNGVFVITSGRSRSFVEREDYMSYLAARVKYYEERVSPNP
jgi:O-antigen ligase/tetratricopeptide (TPR) repeat protein